MQPHYSQSSRENETPSSGTSPLACYYEVPPPPGGGGYSAVYVKTTEQIIIAGRNTATDNKTPDNLSFGVLWAK